ncbi:MAG: hypothetical protein JW915_08710, partial [Chitinispirillaceae bacterium]|nr:hypothetical protein [Chitinispirillaceae bacterium]
FTGWASHPVISATVACHPGILIGTYQVLIKNNKSLQNNQLCDLVSQLTAHISGYYIKGPPKKGLDLLQVIQ